MTNSPIVASWADAAGRLLDVRNEEDATVLDAYAAYDDLTFLVRDTLLDALAEERDETEDAEVLPLVYSLHIFGGQNKPNIRAEAIAALLFDIIPLAMTATPLPVVSHVVDQARVAVDEHQSALEEAQAVFGNIKGDYTLRAVEQIEKDVQDAKKAVRDAREQRIIAEERERSLSRAKDAGLAKYSDLVHVVCYELARAGNPSLYEDLVEQVYCLMF